MAYWIWLTLSLLVLYVLYRYYKCEKYYAELKVPRISELPIVGLFGSNLFFQKHLNEVIKDVYDSNREAKYLVSLSLFNPLIIIRDLDLIKSVLVKNFDHFANHVHFADENNDPLLSKNLALLNGDKWREVRNLLSPSFTSSKMRTMHVLMTRCAENFTDKLIERYGDKDATDMKDVFSRFMADSISSCAFGLEIDSLNELDNEFYVTGKKCSFNSIKIILKMTIMSFFPKLTAKLGMKIIQDKETKFFVDVIRDTVKTRDEKGITRPDMLQLLMDARDDNDSFDILEMTAQAFIFFLAGFDTTSDALGLIAHELAINPDIQDKLRAEVEKIIKKCNGKPTYEDIKNMRYLDAVFNETMRMHPIGMLSRSCSKDFELPPGLPDSKPLMVKVGMEIIVPVAAIHRDPDYYENPEKFDPERYLNEKITSDVLNLGFGLGPRMCIGNRFAILEIKTLLVHLLSKCRLEPCEKTCIPFKYNPNSISPSPKGGFWLRIKPLN